MAHTQQHTLYEMLFGKKAMTYSPFQKTGLPGKKTRIGGLFPRVAKAVSPYLPNLPFQQFPMTGKQMIGYSGVRGVGVVGQELAGRARKDLFRAGRRVRVERESVELPYKIRTSREARASRGMSIKDTQQQQLEEQIRLPYKVAEAQEYAFGKYLDKTKGLRRWFG